MSRTGLTAGNFTKHLRRMCGDGSMEWIYEPMQTTVLLDMADALDEGERLKAENARLRELVRWMYDLMDESCAVQHPYAPAPISYDRLMHAFVRARELGIKV